LDPAQALKIGLAIRAIDSALTAREALEAERSAIDKLQRELAERQSRLLRAKDGQGDRSCALSLRT
jgi:hypothetical protein